MGTAWANSCGACCFHCCCWTAGNCILPCCPSALDDETTKATEAAAPGSTKTTHYDMARAYRKGVNSHGIAQHVGGRDQPELGLRRTLHRRCEYEGAGVVQLERPPGRVQGAAARQSPRPLARGALHKDRCELPCERGRHEG